MKSSASEPGLTVRCRSRRAAKLNISGKRTGFVRARHWKMFSLSETYFYQICIGQEPLIDWLGTGVLRLTLRFTTQMTIQNESSRASFYNQTPIWLVFSFTKFPENSVRSRQNIRWLVRTKHCPRFQNTYQNPKTLLRIQKHLPESKFWDVFWILGPVLDSGACFGLNSRKCFWILGSVFGFWEVFLESGMCFVLMSHRKDTNFWVFPVENFQG